jgi:hypothetical protein
LDRIGAERVGAIETLEVRPRAPPIKVSPVSRRSQSSEF